MRIADVAVRCRGGRPSERKAGSVVYGHTREATGDVDEVLLLILRAPHSYTREDMVEIQGHGGNQSAKRNLRIVLEAGARVAEPGEFTRRAFLNGRLDLLQAEAVLDLIRARSDRAAAAALEQLEGHLSAQFNALYDETVEMAGDLEATLDFPEEELPPWAVQDIVGRLTAVQAKLRDLLATWDEGHLLREGARVVIAGRPNVGKSTLLNALLGMERAIVSEIPGTTRDTIEEGFVLHGIPLRLVDTAGLREARDEIESEGVRRARWHLGREDLFLYVVDASRPRAEEDPVNLGALQRRRCVVVMNKTDLGRKLGPQDFAGYRSVATSLLDGSGLAELKEAMADMLEKQAHSGAEPHAVISERHRGVLLGAQGELSEALELLTGGREDAVVLAASRLRSGLERLGEATGRHYQDELLDTIFKRFCIGK